MMWTLQSDAGCYHFVGNKIGMHCRKCRLSSMHVLPNGSERCVPGPNWPQVNITDMSSGLDQHWACRSPAVNRTETYQARSLKPHYRVNMTACEAVFVPSLWTLFIFVVATVFTSFTKVMQCKSRGQLATLPWTGGVGELSDWQLSRSFQVLWDQDAYCQDQALKDWFQNGSGLTAMELTREPNHDGSEPWFFLKTSDAREVS